MPLTSLEQQRAINAGIISQTQADQLDQLFKQDDVIPSFRTTHLLYYFGGLIAIGAMSMFMNLGFERFGGMGMAFIALIYGIAGIGLSQRFATKGLKIPAGICATFAIVVTPLAIYGLQLSMGCWPDDAVFREYHQLIKWHWIYLELGTLAIGAVLAWRLRYPFMLMPIAVTLWYMSMDIGTMLTGDYYHADVRSWVSIGFGLGMIFLALWVDIRSRHSLDYAFWLHVFGVITFWGGINLLSTEDGVGGLIYLLTNLLLVLLGTLLSRRVFVIFGGLGVFRYLNYLANMIFPESWLYPVALTFIGLGIMMFGVYWQKNEQHLAQILQGHLPKALQQLLQRRC